MQTVDISSQRVKYSLTETHYHETRLASDGITSSQKHNKEEQEL